MGNYTILRNSQLEIQLASDYQNNGWSFNEGIAIHSSLNSGSIRNIIFKPEINAEYTIIIQVSGLASGSLEVYLGGVLFGTITEAGYYELSGVTEDASGLVFTTGLTDLQITSLQVNEGLNEGQTIVYDSESKMYIGHVSVYGDRMERFLDDLIVFKDGQPWIQDKNPIRNNFFGTQYPSTIKFYCNVNYDADKDFFAVTINGNNPWRVDITAPPREGKMNGQRTRIKPGNFNFFKGKYIADILRDMNDPNFQDELQALMSGGLIQGKYIEVTLTNNKDTEVHLISVETDVSIK